MAAASNLTLRLVTAAVSVPVILGLLFAGPPWAFYLLVLAAALVGVTELLRMTHQGDRASQAAGAFVSAVASVVVYLRPGDPHALLTVLVLVPLTGPLLTLARPRPLETAALRACALGLAPLFVVVPLTLLAVMKERFGAAGAGAVLLALGLGWFADTVAYFTGKWFGRHKLFAVVSPNKTVEGAVGGLVAAIAWAALASLTYLRDALPLGHAVLLALVAGPLGQAGDLAESLVKRSIGVKDSGAFVPGHGGVLDRVDALIVTAAIVFIYTEWAWVGRIEGSLQR